MSLNYFITGTDTNVGKTYVSACLLNAFSQAGYSTLGIKPISSGGNDAEILQRASTIKLPIELINPISFDLPIAPHLAANKIGHELTVDELINKTAPALNYPADVRIIEGAGGFLVPLNNAETMADFVVRCDLPVILVVGIRLGCLNHALLTYQAIKQSSAKFVGWIANCLDGDVDETDGMIETLRIWIPNYFSMEVSPDENDCKVPSSSFINR
jgi:dethiobiotin synthetase